MDEPVGAVRQDVKVVHGLPSALGMHAVKGQRGITHHMQPVEGFGYAQAALINMVDRGLGEQFHQPLLERRQVLIGALIGGHNGRLAQRLAIEVLANPGQPLIGEEMLVVEIDHLGLKARPVLGRGIDALWERGADPATGKRTAFDLGAVFGHFKGLLRQFKDLALFVIEHRLRAQGAAVAGAAGTAVQPMNPHLVGRGDRLEGAARVPGWPPGRQPVRERNDLGLGADLASPSLAGGLPLLRLLRASRPRSSWTWQRRVPISRCACRSLASRPSVSSMSLSKPERASRKSACRRLIQRTGGCGTGRPTDKPTPPWGAPAVAGRGLAGYGRWSAPPRSSWRRDNKPR